jgi:hypothetical protein
MGDANLFPRNTQKAFNRYFKIFYDDANDFHDFHEREHFYAFFIVSHYYSHSQ